MTCFERAVCSLTSYLLPLSSHARRTVGLDLKAVQGDEEEPWAKAVDILHL